MRATLDCAHGLLMALYSVISPTDAQAGNRIGLNPDQPHARLAPKLLYCFFSPQNCFLNYATTSGYALKSGPPEIMLGIL